MLLLNSSKKKKESYDTWIVYVYTAQILTTTMLIILLYLGKTVIYNLICRASKYSKKYKFKKPSDKFTKKIRYM